MALLPIQITEPDHAWIKATFKIANTYPNMIGKWVFLYQDMYFGPYDTRESCEKAISEYRKALAFDHFWHNPQDVNDLAYE